MFLVLSTLRSPAYFIFAYADSFWNKDSKSEPPPTHTHNRHRDMFTNSMKQSQFFVCCLTTSSEFENIRLGSVDGRNIGEWSTGDELEVVVA